MSQLKLFNFDSESIPVFVEDDSNIWIHAPSVCKVLDLKNPTLVVQRHVSERYRKKIAVGVGMPAWYVLEPGFYQMVFRSSSPKSETFQRWVFEEVLPTVRKDGGYIRDDVTAEQLKSLQHRVSELQAALDIRTKDVGLLKGSLFTENIHTFYSVLNKSGIRIDDKVIDSVNKILSDQYDIEAELYQDMIFSYNPNRMYFHRGHFYYSYRHLLVPQLLLAELGKEDIYNSKQKLEQFIAPYITQDVSISQLKSKLKAKKHYLQDWVKDCLVFDKNSFLLGCDFVDSYNNWASIHGHLQYNFSKLCQSLGIFYPNWGSKVKSKLSPGSTSDNPQACLVGIGLK